MMTSREEPMIVLRGSAVAPLLVLVPKGPALASSCAPRSRRRRRIALLVGRGRQRLSAHSQHDREVAGVYPELHAELPPLPIAVGPTSLPLALRLRQPGLRAWEQYPRWPDCCS